MPAYNPFIGHAFQASSKEVSEKAKPVIGYKALDIRTENGKMVLYSPTAGGKFDIYGTSKCPNGPFHLGSSKKLSSRCQCGFYSFKESEDAWNYVSKYSKHKIVAKLSNSGHYLEYEDGYRAKISRVTGIQLGTCHFEDAYGTCYNEATIIVKPGGNLNFFAPACKACAKNRLKVDPTAELLTLQDASKFLEILEGYRFTLPEFFTKDGSAPSTIEECTPRSARVVDTQLKNISPRSGKVASVLSVLKKIL